jgi:hypothetical protein
MTLTRAKLTKITQSLRVGLTETQTAAILERFGIEHDGRQEWTEQDVAEQLRHYLRTGSFK